MTGIRMRNPTNVSITASPGEYLSSSRSVFKIDGTSVFYASARVEESA